MVSVVKILLSTTPSNAKLPWDSHFGRFRADLSIFLFSLSKKRHTTCQGFFFSSIFGHVDIMYSTTASNAKLEL